MSDDARFRALSNANRRTILVLVRDQERSVGTLADELGLSQPAVSQHLAVLREAGLVSVARAGKCRLYRADAMAVRETAAFFQNYWESAVDQLAAVAQATAAERSIAS